MINAEKRSVCITGTGRGLGRQLVETFLKDTKYHVVSISRQNSSTAFEKYSGRFHHIVADIGTENGLEKIENRVKNLPPIGVLIHNAGALLFKPFVEIKLQELESIYKVNVFAPFMLTQKLLPFMKAAHVINISSVGGVQGSVKFSGLSAYSSSKAALNCLTEMWSEEFKDTAHVFNCLALGSVETEMFQTAFPGVDASSTPAEMSKYIVNFALEAPKVMRGKIISLSRSNP